MAVLSLWQLDGGSWEDRIETLKARVGLRPDQSFQDLDVEPEPEDYWNEEEMKDVPRGI